MRFHLGVSFSWKQLKKIILPILIGIGLYFGLNMTIVNAESFTLPITGGGGGLTYTDGTKGGQNSWCTKTINSTEYVYRCGGLYDDYFTAGISSGMPNMFLSYSTQWYGNTNALCTTSQTSIEFFVYAEPNWSGGYDFWDYYDISSIAYPSASNGNCSYSRIGKNMLKVNCVYNTGSSVQFNMYGSLNNKVPPNQSDFRLLMKRNINYFCTATTGDLNNSLNDGFNNLNNAITNGFNKLNQDLKDSMESVDETIKDDSIDIDGATGFFDDFDDDDFGLSDIVKAPLTIIRSLSTGNTCQDLNFSVLGANVSMPSGCILWDKVPSNIESIYYVFIGGLFAYILAVKLFHDVNDLKDPEKSEVSTLDL